MNSIPSSKFGGLACCLLVLFALTGTALAFQDDVSGLDEEYRVGSDAAVTYTISDPFTDVANQYALQGETELENVSWTVSIYRAGSQINETVHAGGNFSRSLNVDGGGDEVRIELEGTVPAVENYTYDPAERFVVANLTRVSGDNPTTFSTDRAHHYTDESEDAREAIEDARQAIEAAGGHEDAAALVDNAISSYESEDFDNAVDLAGQAQSDAEATRSAAQRNRLILIAAGVVIVIGLVVGGFLYWRSGRDEYSKL